MSYSIGDEVRFRYTGYSARIIELRAGDMYKVRMLTGPDQGEEFPAFDDDLVLAIAFQGVEVSPYQKKKAKKGLGQQNHLPSTEDMFFSKEEQAQRRQNQGQVSPKKPQESAFEAPQFEYLPVSEEGLFLAFVTMSPNAYTLYLLNDTKQGFNFNSYLYLRKLEDELLHEEKERYLASGDYLPIGDLPLQELNEAPTLDLELPVFQWQKTVKIQARKLLNQAPTQVPLIGLEVPNVCLATLKDFKASKSLKAYTQDKVQEEQGKKRKVVKRHFVDARQAAYFNPEIDLHLEKLVKNPKSVPFHDILHLQLRHLAHFLDRALSHHAHEVRIVHGLGEGRLRQEVEEVLRRRQIQGYIKSYGRMPNNPGCTLVTL